MNNYEKIKNMSIEEIFDEFSKRLSLKQIKKILECTLRNIDIHNSNVCIDCAKGKKCIDCLMNAFIETKNRLAQQEAQDE